MSNEWYRSCCVCGREVARKISNTLIKNKDPQKEGCMLDAAAVNDY